MSVELGVSQEALVSYKSKYMYFVPLEGSMKT